MSPSDEDARHLALLSLFHYVVAGLLALIACIPLLHVAFGIFFVFFPEAMEQNHSHEDIVAARIFGSIFILMGGFFVLIGWALAICLACAGYFLGKHRRRLFCLIVAGISCMFMPFGTVLGIFTLIVLTKSSVIALFGNGPAARPS
jgi:hypothetical protein